MPRPRHNRTTVSTVVLSITFATVIASGLRDTAFADPPFQNAEALRQKIQQKEQEKQNADKELTLRKGAADVSMQRVQELQKQLEAAQKRAVEEQAAAQKMEADVAALSTALAELQKVLPQHEAADALVARAAEASGRLATMQEARQKLQTELAGLRKSAVEWRSKGTDADQQIAALIAQRPELEKKANETKAAADAAEATVTTALNQLNAAKTAMETMATALSQDEARIVEAKESLDRIGRSIGSLEKSLTTLRDAAKLTGVDSTAAIQSLEKALADFAPVKTNTDAVLASLVTRRDEQNKNLAVAKAELEKKTAEHQAATAAAEPMRAAYKAASEALAANVSNESRLKTVKNESDMWQKTLNAQLTGLEPSLQKIEAELQIVSAETLVVRREAESALEPLGRFVSFSRHVAPILAQRCVACHNTRSPGGRLNLDSFAALSKGGEAGPAFHASKSGESLLLTMIQDGSMPKDADPLTAEQIDVVRRWIDVGAPLDAGVGASSDLFDVMPELAQPQPPKEYRVPIPVTAIAFSPDGSRLVSSGYHEVLLWNAADGSLARRITNVSERVYDVEFTADGNSIVVAAGTPGQLGELKQFSAVDGSLTRTLVRSRDAIFAVAISPDGSKVACAGADRSISIVNMMTGEPVVKIEDHADWVMDINWSPNGQRLVSASKDKTCKVFDATNGNPVITFPGHGEPVYSAAFLSDSATVTSGGGDKRIRVWQSADAKELRGIGGFGGDVFRIQILPDNQVLSASGDGNVYQHKSADGGLVRKFSGHKDWVYTVSSSLSRKQIASGSYDGEVRVWNMDDGSSVSSFIAVPRENSVAATGESK